MATGYHTTRGPALEALRDLAEHGAPLVMLLDRSPDPRIPSIRIDDELGAYLATRHLVSLGHRRIGHISILGGRMDDDDGSPQFDRYQGYRRALVEADLTSDPDYVVQGVGLMAGGRESALRLLARFPDPRQRPTAIFVYNDLAAVGVLRALYEAGVRVPEDMAIVGFHGLEVGQFTTPALTSISHARAELGEMGATLLLERIAHPSSAEPPGEQVLPVELLIRESCGGGEPAVSQYILRRVLSMVPVLLIVSVIAFALLYVLPGDPAVAILGDSAGNQQTYLALRHDLGLDQPLHAQYLSWLGRVLQGDLGRSIRTNEAVSTVLLQRVPISLYLGAAGLLVGLALGLSVAVVSALRPGSRIDSFGTLLAMGGVAIPSFWQALLLVYVFAVVLRWLPPSGFTSPFTGPAAEPAHVDPAGDCPGDAFGGGHHAPGPLGADGGAGAGLHHHRALEGSW